MSEFTYDLFVIGAGSGGVRAARMAAGKGKRVAVAEERDLGGTCVNVGCVPKKLFYYGAHFSEELHDASAYGWDVKVEGWDWPTLRDNKTREIERLNRIYQNLLDNSGVEIVRGRATITGPHSVMVAGQEYQAEHILIATGGWPWTPDLPGKEHIITSNDAFYLEQFPQRVAVVGGGYIAVEFAGIFNGLGAETHLVYRGPMILRGFDHDVRDFTAEQMQAKGVNLHLDCDVMSIAKLDDGSLLLNLHDGRELVVDQVMYATGRRPYTDGLGLSSVRVKTDDSGYILHNDYYQTDEPSIFALGDVCGGMELTPVALAEAMALVYNLFEANSVHDWRKVDYENIPTAVFCQPNIATVGLTEEQARERGAIDVYKSTFRAMKHTLTDNPERTLMKLVVDRVTQRVLGAHMVGPEAGELIQGIAIALKAGATKQHFDATIGIHPTAAEEFVTMREPVPQR